MSERAPRGAAGTRRGPLTPWPYTAALLVGALLGVTAVTVVSLAAPRAARPVLPFLVLLAVILVAWSVRRGRVELLGPLFYYDLVRLARRGRSTLLRCTYGLLLLGGLYAVYTSHFPTHDPLERPFGPGPAIPQAQLAAFAQTFASTILSLQAAAVLVLTPAYVAGAIAEERERRTLELLFTTHLHDREIVLGKLFARLGHIGGVLLAGLPVLCLTQLWGGVDVRILLAGFAATGLTLLSVGSISILVSVLTRRVVNAVLSSYALVLLFSLGCLCSPFAHLSSPIAFLSQLDLKLSNPDATLLPGSAVAVPTGMPGPPPDVTTVVLELLATYAVVHGLVALCCAAAAVSQLRPTYPEADVLRPALAAPPRPVADRAERRPAVRAAVVVDRPRPVYTGPRPWRPVTDQPLLWKEAHFGAALDLQLSDVARPWLLFGLIVLLLMLYIHLAWPAAGSESTRQLFHPGLRVLSICLTGCWCVLTGFRAAGSITGERDRRTLDGLLTLPVTRDTILGAKWLGSILRWRALGYGLVLIWTGGLLTGTLHPLAVLLLAVACGIHVAFVAGLGVWLSLVSRNTLWANFTMALLLLLVFGGSWLVMMHLGPSAAAGGPGEPDWTASLYETGLSPVRSWWVLAFSWPEFVEAVYWDDRHFAVTLAAALLGLAVFALGAVALVLAARRRFHQEETRGGC